MGFHHITARWIPIKSTFLFCFQLSAMVRLQFYKSYIGTHNHLPFWWLLGAALFKTVHHIVPNKVLPAKMKRFREHHGRFLILQSQITWLPKFILSTPGAYCMANKLLKYFSTMELTQPLLCESLPRQYRSTRKHRHIEGYKASVWGVSIRDV